MNNDFDKPRGRQANDFCGCCGEEEGLLRPSICQDFVCTYRLHPSALKAHYLRALNAGDDEKATLFAHVMDHVDTLNMQLRQRVFFYDQYDDDEYDKLDEQAREKVVYDDSYQTNICSECLSFSKTFGYRFNSLN